MAETLLEGKWHWYSVSSDLEKQGGLKGVTINPLSVHAYGCAGATQKGTVFNITWISDMFLLISMTQEEQELIDAFAKVVEYRPFCSYTSKENDLLTFEWDKKDPEGRYKKLEEEGELNLKRVS
jgi:hypothetical protein